MSQQKMTHAQIERLQQRLEHVEATLQDRLKFETLVNSISNQLISVPLNNIDGSINTALQAIGQFAGVERSYVARFSGDGVTIHKTYEWWAPGRESQLDQLQDVPISKFPWTMETLRRGEMINVPNVAELPAAAATEREHLGAQNIQSIIMAPINFESRLIGFLGFDSMGQPKTWTEADIRLLRIVANMFAGVFARQHNEETRRADEYKFRRLVEESLDGIVLVNEDGLIIEWNHGQEMITGLVANDVLGRPVWDVQLEMVEKGRQTAKTRNLFKTQFWQLLSTGQGGRLGEPVEITIQHRDGEPRVVQQRAFAIKTDKGFMLGSITRDITNTQQTDALISQQAEDLALLNRLNNAVNHGDSLAAIYDLLNEELKLGFSTLETAVFLFDPDRTQLMMQNTQLSPVMVAPIEKWLGLKIPQIKVPVGPNMPYGPVISSGESQLLNTPEEIQQLIRQFVEILARDYLRLPPLSILVQGIYRFLGIKSIIAVPLVAGGEVIGLLAVSSTRIFSLTDIRRIEAIGLQLTNIIKRKQTEEKLREERQLLRTLIDTLPDHIYVKDTEHHFLINNAAHIRSLGKTQPEEVIGKSDMELYPRELASIYLADEQQVFETGMPLSKAEEPVIHQATGEQLYFMVTKVPLRDQNGVITGLVGISRNVTSLKHTQQELERLLVAERRQRLMAETLREVTLALAGQTHPTAVLDEILLQVERLIPYTAANIMLLEGNVLKLARSRGFEKFEHDDKFNQLALPLTRFGMEAAALKTRQSIVISDIRQEPGWIPLQETPWIRSHLMVPICRGDYTLGVLQLDSDTPNAFTYADVELLEPLSSAAAIALDNARLYEQARQDAATKSTLLREVNHRVGNNLTAISGMLALERHHLNPADQSAYQTIMRDLTNRINGLATVHAMLSATEWAPLPLDDLVNRVIHSSLQMLPFDKHVAVNVSTADARISSDRAHHLAMIINELTTNTVKYALNHKDRARIAVTIAVAGPEVVLMYTDDGPGYPDSVLKRDNWNVGLELIDNLMRTNLHGDWQLANRQGAVARLQFMPQSNTTTLDHGS